MTQAFCKTGFALTAALAVISLAGNPLAAAPTVTLNLTGVSGGSLGGVYTSPYYGNINGGSTIPVICDDFKDESFLPETWNAFATNLSTLPSATSGSPDLTYLQWGSDANTSLGTDLGLGAGFSLNQTQEYDVAAYLITELLNPSSGLNNNDLSFAIWGLFDQDAFTSIGGTDLTNATTYLTTAIQAVGTPASQSGYANVNIYTYAGEGVTNCGGCAPPPQEFITVTTPEASMPVLLGVDLFGLVALVGFLRKRVARQAQG